ncbi:MAG: hypothetical protein ABSF80_05080 [Chitinispirillaceae bacterium]|jgi:hypothetical protein
MNPLKNITVYWITVFLLVLLPWASNGRCAGAAGTNAVDSLQRAARYDSLARIQETNRHLYDHTSAGSAAFSVSTPVLFTADNTGPSEALSASPLCVPVSFGLSNRMNRFLLYGNVAPITQIFSDQDLLFTVADALKGTDDVCTSEISAISLLPANRCRYTSYPAAPVVPEGSFYWENGVFKEDVLTVRFARPLSERLAINVFSDYRHFDAATFDHQGNSVFSFYQGVTPDTTTLVDNGYNPLTNEYTAGARLKWTGRRGSEVLLGAKYTDCVNELALDRPADDGMLAWGRFNQYRTTFDLGSINNRVGMLGLDLQGRFESDALVRYTPDAGNFVRSDGVNKELSFGAQAQVPLRDSAGALAIIYRMKQITRKPFDFSESSALEQTPELSLTLRRRLGPFRASCTATAGYEVFRLDRVFGYTSSWSISAEAAYGGQLLRAYAKQTALPCNIPYDSATMDNDAPLLDHYRVAGSELLLERGAASIVLGCQSIEGVEPITVRNAWPEATPPYEQPDIVFLAAPSLGPWHGFTLSSRTMIADRRPVVKTNALLSCTTHPADTREYFDIRLGFDYWSPRDPVVFANILDWNRPVCNVSFELAVHVISFRFFGKIDNLLDRKYAYVPGYYTPGVTFRWGFCWFLQR